MRDTKQALERINSITHVSKSHWIIEGDVRKFFDTVNHTTLIKKLWHMGIRDRRLLMIIKSMLKAKIMGEIQDNTLGMAQGSILSPLLSNVYLHSFDMWIHREWTGKMDGAEGKSREYFRRHATRRR